MDDFSPVVLESLRRGGGRRRRRCLCRSRRGGRRRSRGRGYFHGRGRDWRGFGLCFGFGLALFFLVLLGLTLAFAVFRRHGRDRLRRHIDVLPLPVFAQDVVIFFVVIFAEEKLDEFLGAVTVVKRLDER